METQCNMSLLVETVNTKKSMKFKLPFKYTVKGLIEVEAVNLNEAINKLHTMAADENKNQNPVLDAARYLHNDLSTLEVDELLAEEMNPINSYTITIRRLVAADVHVEGYGEADARKNALKAVESGTVADGDFDEEDIWIEKVVKHHNTGC